MSKVKKSIRTSSKQRETLRLISIYLAEMGYWRFPAPAWYRRTRYDFIMVRKLHGHALSVRPMMNGTVSVRPYEFPNFYKDVKAKIALCRRRAPTKIRWTSQQIPKGKGSGPRRGENGLKTFFSDKSWRVVIEITSM